MARDKITDAQTTYILGLFRAGRSLDQVRSTIRCSEETLKRLQTIAKLP